MLDPATGSALSGANVAVAVRSTAAAATIYAAETGGTTVANPRTTDTYGRLTGWVERGAYTLTISGSTLTTYVKNWDSAPAADSTIDALWSANGNPLVTSLPASPIDGQECYYQADATNGIIWNLRYRAASASAYKWELVGGSGLQGYSDATETTTSASLTATGFTSITQTAPLAGDYVLIFGCNAYATTAGNVQMGISVSGAAPDSTTQTSVYTPATNAGVTIQRQQRKTGVTASTTFQAQHAVQAGTGSFRYRSLAIQPLRVG